MSHNILTQLFTDTTENIYLFYLRQIPMIVLRVMASYFRQSQSLIVSNYCVSAYQSSCKQFFMTVPANQTFNFPPLLNERLAYLLLLKIRFLFHWEKERNYKHSKECQIDFLGPTSMIFPPPPPPREEMLQERNRYFSERKSNDGPITRLNIINTVDCKWGRGEHCDFPLGSEKKDHTLRIELTMTLFLEKVSQTHTCDVRINLFPNYSPLTWPYNLRESDWRA